MKWRMQALVFVDQIFYAGIHPRLDSKTSDLKIVDLNTHWACLLQSTSFASKRKVSGGHSVMQYRGLSLDNSVYEVSRYLGDSA